MVVRYKGSALTVYKSIAHPFETLGEKARVIRRGIRRGKIPKTDFDAWLFNHRSAKEIKELKAYAKFYKIRLPKA
jgi:hypothetical protein